MPKHSQSRKRKDRSDDNDSEEEDKKLPAVDNNSVDEVEVIVDNEPWSAGSRVIVMKGQYKGEEGMVVEVDGRTFTKKMIFVELDSQDPEEKPKAILKRVVKRIPPEDVAELDDGYDEANEKAYDFDNPGDVHSKIRYCMQQIDLLQEEVRLLLS